MTADQRRAAEVAMRRRDVQEGRRGPGARAARRGRQPDFLGIGGSDLDDEDDEDGTGGLLAGMKPRARRQYDERRTIDDAEGIEDVRLSHLFC